MTPVATSEPGCDTVTERNATKVVGGFLFGVVLGSGTSFCPKRRFVGSFARVRACWDVESAELLAVKIYALPRLAARSRLMKRTDGTAGAERTQLLRYFCCV